VKSKAALSLMKYKSKAELLIEEYQNPTVPGEKMYVIDKVVRMRGLQGRYGVDHSEILNYEFEQANKDRYDHLNQLVYKSASNANLRTESADGDKENSKPALHKTTASNALFERLTEKEIKEMKRVHEDDGTDERAISFNEWLRRKDAERRMKRRLINDAKKEIRQELFSIA
jgi:hypothetical protein